MTYTDNRRTILGAGQLLLGLILCITPWVVGFTAEQIATRTALVTGTGIALVGLAAVLGHALAAGWINLVAGVWAVLAPWIVGFSALAGAMWSHVIFGALVALAAGIALWLEYEGSTRIHA